MIVMSCSLSASGLMGRSASSLGMVVRGGGEERVEEMYFWEISARGAKRRMVGTATAVVLRSESQDVG